MQYNETKNKLNKLYEQADKITREIDIKELNFSVDFFNDINNKKLYQFKIEWTKLNHPEDTTLSISGESILNSFNILFLYTSFKYRISYFPISYIPFLKTIVELNKTTNYPIFSVTNSYITLNTDVITENTSFTTSILVSGFAFVYSDESFTEEGDPIPLDLDISARLSISVYNPHYFK